ncbi:MAG: DNA polymerase III subunit delta' [Desulfovibrionaceae bacterium]|nr:DNA polymerase III subunit delta' [Desulfovibrionaceae bacterium]MBF0512466.1 DNA polymerase III subunit delta' [Desulfovibrionaceae bacterium]
MDREQLVVSPGGQASLTTLDSEPAIRKSSPPSPWAIPPRLSVLAGRLDRLAFSPPQAMLFEGGDADDRIFMALYWAARLNCQAEVPPCGLCASCIQIAQKVHLDLIVFDGREGAIKVDHVRDIRIKALEPPRGPGARVIVLAEAQELTIEAANALLKSMEEPRPGNCFVLLAPLRERLLPTLVSRSWVMSLPWALNLDGAASPAASEEMDQWLAAFAGFVRSGTGWFERTAIKGRVPRQTAAGILLAMEREVARALIGGHPPSGAGDFFACLEARELRRLDEILRESQEAVTAMVNPSLVLDRLAVRVYNWTRDFSSD